MSPGRGAEQDPLAIDGGSPLIRAARVFATRAHAHQRRESDGAPFIEHPLDVARVLRGAGRSDVLVAAGLLHDVLEETSMGGDELSVRFGARVTALVCAVSDDAEIGGYRERKRRLREQVRQIGGDAAVLFAADKICKVRELRVRLQADPGFTAQVAGKRTVDHYRRSLTMLEHTIPGDPLVRQLRIELEAVCGPSPRKAGHAARLGGVIVR